MGIVLFFRRPEDGDKSPWVVRDEETGKEQRVMKIYSKAKHESEGPVKGLGAKYVIRYPNGYAEFEGATAWIRDKKQD
jgi:hypothetical protein